MNRSYFFARLTFAILTWVFVTATLGSNHFTFLTPLYGALFTAMIVAFCLGLEHYIKKFTLLTFNTTILGLFFGYLMGMGLLVVLRSLLSISTFQIDETIVTWSTLLLVLCAIYVGVMMTLKASHELYVSIPFIKFTPDLQKTKEILVDPSALTDERIIDLAGAGLLDNRLVIARFILKELYEQEESKDEAIHTKAKLALEIIRKLETIPDLHIRYSETDFVEVKELTNKVLRLARLLNADVLTTDINRVQIPIEGIRIINIHALSAALKPLMQRGEYLNIKIQRHGKEERQGVGYLEDGTMIVVNGGGDFIGKSIKACVLSVKHTTTGRMIFCNVADLVNSDI